MQTQTKELMEPTMALVFRVLSVDLNATRLQSSFKPQVQYVDLTIGDEPERKIKITL